jgi:dTDP-4-amino-4,6-dideoxygalactose transaminase
MISASLGAHYSSHFVTKSIGLWWQTLVSKTSQAGAATDQLKNQLKKQFGGQIVLTYKGRDAIELALKAHGLTNTRDVVLTQAFTCFAIEEAIIRAGATPGYVDIGEGQLNMTVKTLEQAHERINQAGQSAKAVIVQHSLGHPAEIAKIAAWCKTKQLLLIEDLAQSFGAAATDSKTNLTNQANLDKQVSPTKPIGQPLGSLADVVILSFGRDKIIDAVSGGGVIFRTPSKQNFQLSQPAKTMILKDLAYPLLTWLIRTTYNWGLGKLIHKIATAVHLMTNPTQSPTNQVTGLPESLATLALLQLEQIDQAHQHRAQIAQLYLSELSNTPLQFITNQKDLESASLLRVAGTTNQPLGLLNFLKRHNIHLYDRWYRSPVDCGKLNCPTKYQPSSCSNAEQLANTIINLPTHQKITSRDAKKIIKLIKKYFETEKK